MIIYSEKLVKLFSRILLKEGSCFLRTVFEQCCVFEDLDLFYHLDRENEKYLIGDIILVKKSDVLSFVQEKLNIGDNLFYSLKFENIPDYWFIEIREGESENKIYNRILRCWDDKSFNVRIKRK